MSEPHLSQQAYERLQQELDERSTTRRREISRQIERGLGRFGRDPVLEAVGRDRRFGVVADEQQPRHTAITETGETLRITGPAHELDVHSCNVRPDCFAAITRW